MEAPGPKFFLSPVSCPEFRLTDFGQEVSERSEITTGPFLFSKKIPTSLRIHPHYKHFYTHFIHYAGGGEMGVPIAGGHVEERLVQAMEKAGFPLAKHAPLHERPMGSAIYRSDELFFNRALDGKSSSFCVLATRERDGSLIAHWYNPDPGGFDLKRDAFLKKVRLPKDASEDMVAELAGRISADAAFKKPGQLFFDPHTHFGSYSPPVQGRSGEEVRWGQVGYDDGVSYLTDNLRKAMFYHIDYYALTTHNRFSKKAYDILSWAGRHLGIQPVPAVELTAPLREPNGPHFLAYMRNSAAAEALGRAVLSKRKHMDMPSYFSGMDMGAMLDSLFALQKSGLAILGLAHPVNLSSPRLPIPIVGLYSAVDTGAITLEEAHSIAQRFDTVAMWNPSLHAKADEVRVQSAKLKRFLRHVNQKHVGNQKLWVNQTNYALAQELSGSFGINTHFETDEHKTLPFMRHPGAGGYVLGGDSLAIGMTVVEAPGGFIGGRPGVPQFIEMIRKREAIMSGRVFAVARPEAMTVYSERGMIPDELRDVAKRAENALTRRYAGMVIHDFIGMLFSGGFGGIGNMAGD
jgi:hypothetical protein